MKKYKPLSKSYKNLFPFKLSVPSYIYPDNVIPNVKALGPYVDEIELILFDSQYDGSLPTRSDIYELKEIGLDQNITYNVHLPTDISLTDFDKNKRGKALDKYIEVLELTSSLDVSANVLHLDFAGSVDDKEFIDIWRGIVEEGLKRLKERYSNSKRITIETLDYSFGLVGDIVRAHDYSVCFDIGHNILFGYDYKKIWEEYKDIIKMIHFHGVKNGVDHLSLKDLSNDEVFQVIKILQNYSGVVSVEVFSYDKLESSLIKLSNIF